MENYSGSRRFYHSRQDTLPFRQTAAVEAWSLRDCRRQIALAKGGPDAILPRGRDGSELNNVVTMIEASNVDTVSVADKLVKWQGKLVGVDLARLRRPIEKSRRGPRAGPLCARSVWHLLHGLSWGSKGPLLLAAFRDCSFRHRQRTRSRR